MSSFANDDVTQPAQSLSLQRTAPYAVESQLGLLFVGAFTYHTLYPVYPGKLGRQRQVWLIPIVDERVGVQVKL